jgi:fimbrial chaperone protein
MKPFFRPVCLAGALGMAVAGQAQAAATILLWPIDPWLAADANATELWIQNQGNSATTMQVRIVRWKQEDGHERYTAQQDVVASPPIVTIGTGSKQLIRLIKQASVPAGVEQAYRIIVDEIPQPDAKAEPAIGLKLQMRYSIPLFVYGQGSRPSKRGASRAGGDPKPELAGDAGGGQPALEVVIGGCPRQAEPGGAGAGRAETHGGGGIAGLRPAGQHPQLADTRWRSSARADERAD